MFSEMDKVFDSHELYNKWQVVEGMKVSSGIAPSVYITCVKLKRKLAERNRDELKELYIREWKKRKRKKEWKEELWNDVVAGKFEERLIEKLHHIDNNQLFQALAMYLKDCTTFELARYILNCRYRKKNDD